MAEEEVITLWLTAISSSMEIKKNQTRIKNVLESKKIPFKEIDISAGVDNREKMREIVGDASCLPPQLTKGEQYLGDYEAFATAVEDEKLDEFLKLA